MNQDNKELEELREELEGAFDPSDLADLSLDELKEMKAEVDLGDFLDAEIEEFKKDAILTKSQLWSSIQNTRQEFLAEAASEEKEHLSAFYVALDNLMEQFEDKIMRITLPEPLPDWWYYTYTIMENGVQLWLNYCNWSAMSIGKFSFSSERNIKLVEAPAKMLTVSEYARAYGVESVTVRQWIRRAKLRNAVKLGGEWRIPELAELPSKKGYIPCEYVWSSTLTGLPEKYAFLNHFNAVSFDQDEDNKEIFHLELKKRSEDGSPTMWGEELTAFQAEASHILSQYPEIRLSGSNVVSLTGREREELELYLIGNPLVECFQSWIYTWPVGHIKTIGEDGDWLSGWGTVEQIAE